MSKWEIGIQRRDLWPMQRTLTHVTLTIAEYNTLLDTIQRLEKRVLAQEVLVLALEARLNKNSTNSSKPPSSDGYQKAVKNNREVSQQPPGAQVGHPGKTLIMMEHPDKILVHKLQGQCACGQDLGALSIRNIQRRQVIDLPEKLYEVTEHQLEVKQCSCGQLHTASCEAKSTIQYGEKIKALLVYLNQYQFIPFERLQEFSEDCLGLSISDGLLASSNQYCYIALEELEKQIKAALHQSPVIHNDETGIRCTGSTQWIHSTSTSTLTHYQIHPKRGSQAMDAIGILPHYKGTSIHDRWASYNQYTCQHSYCNAHLLRDLKYLHEELQCNWALPMKELLTEANHLKKQQLLTKSKIKEIEKKYTALIEQGFKEEPEPQARAKPTRGKVAKSKTLLLLEVFAHSRQRVLLFLYNENVPFDNNLAERDLRMVKLKQKISGTFRSLDGAQIFCRIRSYISSARKQGYRILDAIQNAISGKPNLLIRAEQ